MPCNTAVIWTPATRCAQRRHVVSCILCVACACMTQNRNFVAVLKRKQIQLQWQCFTFLQASRILQSLPVQASNVNLSPIYEPDVPALKPVRPSHHKHNYKQQGHIICYHVSVCAEQCGYHGVSLETAMGSADFIALNTATIRACVCDSMPCVRQ